MKLYIIGNGFDIYHGIDSRYSDFQNYVLVTDYELFQTLEKYFNTDELWSDFEETLACIDADGIIDDASNYLVSYGADDWSDTDHHNYQYEVDRALSFVTEKLKNHFTSWILGLKIPSISQVNIDPNSIFLNFNYTSTLEKIYKVDSEKILYIHNKAVNEDSVLIIGHSRQFDDEQAFPRYNDEYSDPRIAQGNDLIDEYFKETYKNTKTIIADNITFFKNLACINEVYVLGHSISSVDIPYFQLIQEIVDSKVNWIISYYQEEERNEKFYKAINFGIESSKIIMNTLNEL